MKTIYSDFALTGNLVTLGGNLWNQKVGEAIRRVAAKDWLHLTGKVFFDEILPELQNFMEQKISKEKSH